jgi:hypothetical protein
MRLLALLPELCVMARPVAQATAIALCLGGCGALDQFSSGPAGPTYYPNPSNLYLRDSRLVTVPVEYLDRYECATGKPLMCECMGRVSSTCDCHC